MLISSIKKSLWLRRISRELGRQRSSADYYDMVASERSSDDELVDELVSRVLADKMLSKIASRQSATAEDLVQAYRSLVMLGGCAFWTHGHFVAASALSFGATLDYVLSQMKDDPDWTVIGDRVATYFENRSVGHVA